MNRAEISGPELQVDANAGSLKFLSELRDWLVSQGRFEEATPVCRRLLLCHSPEDRRAKSYAWLCLAIVLCSAGRVEKALATAKTAKRLDDRLNGKNAGIPTDADGSSVWVEFAGLLFGGQRFEEALSAALTAKRLNEKNTDAWVCVALASQRLGRPLDADGAYIMALKFCPTGNLSERRRLYQSYAEFLREQGRLEAAIRNEHLAEICAQTAMREILPPPAAPVSGAAKPAP